MSRTAILSLALLALTASLCEGLVRRADAPLWNIRNRKPDWMAAASPVSCPVRPCKEPNPLVCPLGSHKGEYKDEQECPCPCCMRDEAPFRCLNQDEMLHTPAGAQVLQAAMATMKAAPDEHQKASAVLRAASDFRKFISDKMERAPLEFPPRAGVTPRREEDKANHQKAQAVYAGTDTRDFSATLKQNGFPKVPLEVVRAGRR